MNMKINMMMLLMMMMMLMMMLLMMMMMAILLNGSTWMNSGQLRPQSNP